MVGLEGLEPSTNGLRVHFDKESLYATISSQAQRYIN